MGQRASRQNPFAAKLLSRRRRARQSQKSSGLQLAMERLEDRQLLTAVAPGQAPFGAEHTSNISYAAGNVHATIVFFESEDGHAEDHLDWNMKWDTNTQTFVPHASMTGQIVGWTPSGGSYTEGSVEKAFGWWEDVFDIYNPDSPHDFKFSFDATYANSPIDVPFEGILETDPSGMADDYFLAQVSTDEGETFSSIADWNAYKRDEIGADWAFTVFVFASTDNYTIPADGNHPATSASGFAHNPPAWAAGDLIVGHWGSLANQKTFAHETGHVFSAIDEYGGAINYFWKFGYYGTQAYNANTDRHLDPNAPAKETSIMDADNWTDSWDNKTLPESTREHIGWRDSDNNDVIDIFDEPLQLEDAIGGHVTVGGVSSLMAYHFEGHALPGILPVASGLHWPNVDASTLNFVDAIQVQVVINGSTHTGDLNLAGDATLLPETSDHWFTAETRVRDYEWDASFDIDLDALNITSADDVQLKFRAASWPEYRDGDVTFDYTTDPSVVSAEVTKQLFGDINMSVLSTETTEEGGQAVVEFSLGYLPTGPVTINATTTDSTEGTLNTSSLVFHTTTWDTPQQFIITGVEDFVQDGDISYDIDFTVTSNDPAYSGFSLSSATLSNRDNDLTEYTTDPYFIPVGGSPTDWENPIILSEDGGSTTVDVVMTVDPNVTAANPVTMTLYTTAWNTFPFDTSEVTIDVTTLSFDSTNWNVPQTITITPIDDTDHDGEQKVKVWGLRDDSPFTQINIPIIVRDNEYARVTEVEVNDQAGNGLGWIDGSVNGISYIDVTFDEAVTFTSSDVTIEKYAEGDLTSTPTILTPTSVTGSGTTEMRIALNATQTTDAWLKVTLDGSAIEDSDNNLLDGDAPGSLIGSGRDYLYNDDDLPSGDGIAGGDAIFFVGNKIGDLDADGDVDLDNILTAFGNFTGPNPVPPGTPFTKTLAEGDLDGDGDIETSELLIMNAEFTGPDAGLDALPSRLSIRRSATGRTKASRKARATTCATCG